MTRFKDIDIVFERTDKSDIREYIKTFDAVLEKILVMTKDMKVRAEDVELVAVFKDMVKSEAENGKTLKQLVSEYQHFRKTE